MLEEFAWTVSDAQICPCLHVSVNRARPAKSVFESNTFLVVRCFYSPLAKIMCVKTGEIASSQDLSLDLLQPQLAVCPAKIWSVLCTYHNYISPNSLDGICMPLMAHAERLNSLLEPSWPNAGRVCEEMYDMVDTLMIHAVDQKWFRAFAKIGETEEMVTSQEICAMSWGSLFCNFCNTSN